MRNVTPIKKFGSHKKPNDLAVVLLSASPHKQTGIYRPTIEFSDGHTLLYKQLQVIDNVFPNADTVVVLGHEPDEIYKNPYFQNIRFIENQNYLSTNTIKSAALALRATHSSSYLFIHGDLLFNDKAISIAGNESQIVISNNPIINDKIGTVSNDGKVTNLSYGLEKNWGQIVYMTGKELDIFKEFCYNKTKAKCLLFEGLNHVIDCSGNFYTYSQPNIEIKEILSKKDI